MKKHKLNKVFAVLLCLSMVFGLFEIVNAQTMENASVETTRSVKEEQEKFIQELTQELIAQGIIISADELEVKFNEGEMSSSRKMVNTAKEAAKIIKKDSDAMDKINNTVIHFPTFSLPAPLAQLKPPTRPSYTTSARKTYVQKDGSANLELSAIFAWNSSTKVIQSVTDPYFNITGWAPERCATNQRYHIYYSSDRKAAKVVCNYTTEYNIPTPMGFATVSRKNTYAQFKWSSGNGVYEGRAGNGYGSSSF